MFYRIHVLSIFLLAISLNSYGQLSTEPVGDKLGNQVALKARCWETPNKNNPDYDWLK